MTARQGIREKWMQWKGRPRQEEMIVVSAAVVERLARGLIRLLLAAVLAGVGILDGRAPFGPAMVGASGAGVAGAAAMIGACLGSLLQLELTDGLRYASASILIYAAAFAFYDVRFLRKAWTMPLVTGTMLVFTGLVADSRITWTVEEQVGFLLEVALSVGAVWCFRAALRDGGPRGLREGPAQERRRGRVVLLAVILLALEPLTVLGVSLGRCLAGTVALWAGVAGGSQMGAVFGLVFGLGMDLAQGARVLRAMAWALAALWAGTARGKPRWQGALLWMGAGTVCVLWVEDWSGALQCAGEGVLSALLLLCLPKSWLRQGERWLPAAREGVGDPSGVRAAREKLEAVAQAYQSLCRTLQDSMAVPDNDEDVARVFDRAASRVCRGCALQNRCWNRDYSATFGALNDATAAMVERGRAVAADFPTYFADRCIHLPQFLEGVNEELTALFYRRQYKARVRENRGAVCQQYDQLSALLHASALELGEELTPHPEGQAKLRRHLARQGLEVRAGVYRDHRGLLRVELEGRDSGCLREEENLRQLTDLLGKPLRLSGEGVNGLSLVEEEPYKALAGVACRKKDGETVSGDAGTYFKRLDGKVYLLLCDGMGSGLEANRESSLAIRLLEQFLRTGIPADHALRTLASALALRGEETGGFTTVDLLEVDLFTGEAVLYKLGAAPTYVRQGDSIRRLSGTSLPAGLAEGTEEAADCFRLRLFPGDCVLMISDGICGTGEDGWILERLSTFSGDSPRTLAAQLITQSPQGATDDRTALVVKLEKRA